MPTGMYPRSAEYREKMMACLQLGREESARTKASIKLRALGQNKDWRESVSKATKAKMHDPAIRSRHLAALETARMRHGTNWKGGNGQALTETVVKWNKILEPAGFIRELAVKTRGQSTTHNPPTSYKVDFGNPITRCAIELDGPCHRPMRKKAKDLKKTEVLESLGWTVLRITHT